ncbi:response regulator transcription factor [Glycomyces harbinensis]|uniref:response regulator transcription factor n=1 Tax=Glycomyces harbinensis TaxID=58114 RepID=UPI001C40B6BC
MSILAGARGVLQVPVITGEDLMVAFAQTIMLVRGAVADAVRLVARQRQPEGPALTARELQVLKCMSEGMSNAEIGRDLRVTEDTVKTHAKRMYRKLEAHDRAQAVAIALRTGMLP